MSWPTVFENAVGLISARSSKSSSSSSSSPESSMISDARFWGIIGFDWDEDREGRAVPFILGLKGNVRVKNFEMDWSRRGNAGCLGKVGGLLAWRGGEDESETSDRAAGCDSLFKVVRGFETTCVGCVT